MTLTEAAVVLGIDAGLARQLAEDAQFPVTGGGGDANRLPVSEVAMLSRVLHRGRATGSIRRETPWRGSS
jgi:hypothetical protein